MRRIFFAGIGALALACGGGSGDSIQYGAPQTPTLDEEYAVGSAQATLSSTAAFSQSTEPAYGAPGLADQLAADLGAYGGESPPPASPAQALASRALARRTGRALTVGMEPPECVVQQVDRVDWTDCLITASEYDPVTGDSLDMTVTVNGFVAWNVETGTTNWDLVEVIDMSMTSGGETFVLDATAHAFGSITVGATTIDGHAESRIDETVWYMGRTAHAGVTTTLDLDLDYQPPTELTEFCISGGTLRLEQIWSPRPSGVSEAELPNLGWIITWTGCGEFTIAHGS